MIRHSTDTHWILIPQDAHAKSCAQMAELLRPDIAPPRSKSALLGIAMHDSGWPLHDDNPTLDAKGQPAHVFEMPPALVVDLWTQSAQRAAEADPYAGLLASIHGLHLTAFALNTPRDRQTVFTFTKFQQAQIEFQQQLRQKLGLQTNRPVHNGLARPGVDPAEDQLTDDYCVLRLLDQISLATLCSETPFEKVSFSSLATHLEMTISFQKHSHFAIKISPWIFASDSVSLQLSCKKIAQQSFAGLDSFRGLYRHAPVEDIEIRLMSDD